MGDLNEQDLVFIERFLLSFKVLGGNTDGLIDYNLFKSHLEKKGDALKDILLLINEEQCLKDNNLDYFQLCASILATKVSFNILSLENGRVRNANIPVNTHTYTRRKNSSQASIADSYTEENVKSEIFTQQMGGSVFRIEKDMLSNRYLLEILEDSWIELYAKPTKPHEDLNIPVEILIFQDKNRIAFASSSFINSEGCSAMKHHFGKGRYSILPVLMHWPEEEVSPPERLSLARLTSSGEDILSHECEEALRMVFDMVDLDCNGLLSQLEFDLFIQHTSGETAADEWSTIEDNFQMEDYQLTFEGFHELYKMVIRTDPEDVVNMLRLMGMNHLLHQQNAEPFILFIKSESSKFLVSPLPVASYRAAAEKSLCKMAVEQGFSKKVKNMNDLFLYSLQLSHWVAIVIQNQSHSKVRVRLNCSSSTNARSHRPNLDFTVNVPPRTTIVGHHLVPWVLDRPWQVKCVEELL